MEKDQINFTIFLGLNIIPFLYIYIISFFVMPRKKTAVKASVKPKLMMKPKKLTKKDDNINIKIKSRGNDELKMDLVKDKKTKPKQEKINPILDKILDEINSNSQLEMFESSMNESDDEQIIEDNNNNIEDNNNNSDDDNNDDDNNDDENSDDDNNDDNNGVDEEKDSKKTIEEILNNNNYDKDELARIVSIDNIKLLTEKISLLQKVEQIEVYRIVKNNDEPKNCQENNNGIWIVMNKLHNDTIVKLHDYVEFRINSKNKLDQEKIQRSKMKDKIKAGKVKNDDAFIKESQLLQDEEKSDKPSGFTDYFSGVSEIGNNVENNLRVDIEVEKNKLTDMELDTLLSERMMMRDRDDEELMVQAV